MKILGDVFFLEYKPSGELALLIIARMLIRDSKILLSVE